MSINIRTLKLEAIYAKDANTGLIGIDNKLPWHLSEDMKRFKEKTMNKIVIMGRLTYESIRSYSPGREPLPGRYKIVLTHDPIYANIDINEQRDEILDRNTLRLYIPKGLSRAVEIKLIIDVCHSTNLLIEMSDGSFVDPMGVIFIGGSTIYDRYCDFCDIIYETNVLMYSDFSELDKINDERIKNNLAPQCYDFIQWKPNEKRYDVVSSIADNVAFVPKIIFTTYTIK